MCTYYFKSAIVYVNLIKLIATNCELKSFSMQSNMHSENGNLSTK